MSIHPLPGLDGNTISEGVQVITQNTSGNAALDMLGQHFASIDPFAYGIILALVFFAISLSKFKIVAKIIQIGVAILIILILAKVILV